MTRLAIGVLALFLSASLVRAEPVTIVGFGDSLMAGYQLDQKNSFPEKLQAALLAKGYDIKITNAGVSGDTTSGGLARIDWSVPKGTDIVILELGANDMLRGIKPRDVEKNLDSMLGNLTGRGVKVLLAGMLSAPNLGKDYASAFDEIYPKLAKKYHVPLYPFFLQGVAATPSLQLADGMHPNAKGVDRMVKEILPTVEKMLSGEKDAS